MENEQHYFRVGVYIIVLVLGMALFAMWLMSSGLKHSTEYRIYFTESVSGLSLGSPVKYRGVSVGQVKEIGIDKNDPRKIWVNVEVSNDTPVKVGTVAGLKLQGITGTVFIELSGDVAADAKDLADATPHDKTPVIPSQASSINAIMNQLPQILDKLSHFADQLDKLTSDENIAQFTGALQNLNAITGDTRQVLRDTKGNIIESTEQLDQTMTNLRKASRDVSSVTDRVKDDPSSLIFPPEEQGIPAP
jgi:phospholipid/cholesterol/gamma-HCH transport system substrate-binding protein